MSAVTITNRVVSNRGTLRQETGNFTDDTTSAYPIKTKLGRIIFFVINGVGTTSTNNIGAFANSASASAVEDDPGTIFVNSGAASGGTYSYLAIGK